jgi:hypothetical protein
VASSAFAVGFLTTIYLTPVSRRYLHLCAVVLLIQALVGLLGFYLHFQADMHGLSPHWRQKLIEGAPILAPLLFPNLVLLAGIGLWALLTHQRKALPAENDSAPSQSIAV